MLLHQYLMVRVRKMFGEQLKKQVWLMMQKLYYMMAVLVNRLIIVCLLALCI